MNDEEDALLASLKASKHDQALYEDEVLRKAPHSLAPTLTAGAGFPSLETLVHSSQQMQPTAHLPHIHNVLTNTRKAQHQLNQSQSVNNDSNESSTKRMELLCLKAQILLDFMQTADELPIRKNEVKWLEKRRKTAREQDDEASHPQRGEGVAAATTSTGKRSVTFKPRQPKQPQSNHQQPKQPSTTKSTTINHCEPHKLRPWCCCSMWNRRKGTTMSRVQKARTQRASLPTEPKMDLGSKRRKKSSS